jgi:hypothetical protein
MSRLVVTPLLMLCLIVTGVTAEAQFETRGQSVVEFDPYSIALGDFNHDGNLDMAVAAAGSGGPTISVLLGKGDGTFLPAVNYFAGVGPTSVVASDFNQDGNLDLAVANSLSFYISIFLGNGDGTFTPGPQNPAVLAPQQYVFVGDFNGDGIPDLIGLSTSNPCKWCISVFLGNGDGTFQAAVVTEPSFDVQTIGLGDFNHDGTLDVVTAGLDSINVLLGNGDGTFSYGASYPSGGASGPVAVAAFSNNHNLDLAIGNGPGGSFSVLMGNGNGTFQPAVVYPVSFPNWITAADLTGNGKLDLIVASNIINLRPPNTSGATVFLGNGNGTFQQPGSFYESVPDLSAFYLTVGDFNNDGKPDIAITDGYDSVIVMLNTGVVSFSPSTMLLFNQQAVGTTSAPQQVTLSNTSSAALNIASIKPAGQFGMTTTCGTSVAAGASCTITVTFSPKIKGKQTGTVTIIDSASIKPEVIAMQGTGTE